MTDAVELTLRDALERLPAFWQPLLDLGVPASALQAELAQLRALPTQDIDSALKGPMAEPWRGLWLGPITGGGVAAMVGNGLAGVVVGAIALAVVVLTTRVRRVLAG